MTDVGMIPENNGRDDQRSQKETALQTLIYYSKPVLNAMMKLAQSQ